MSILYSMRSTNPVFGNEDTLLRHCSCLCNSLWFIRETYPEVFGVHCHQLISMPLIYFAVEWMTSKYVSGFPSKQLSDLCVHNLHLIQRFCLWDLTNIKFSFPNPLINWIIENRMDLRKWHTLQSFRYFAVLYLIKHSFNPNSCVFYFFSSWEWYKTWVKWELCSVMTIRTYELGTQFVWYGARNCKSCFVPSYTCLKKKMSPFFPQLAVPREFLSTEVKEQLFTNGSQQENKHSSLGRGYFSLLCNLFLNILSSVVDYKVCMWE